MKKIFISSLLIFLSLTAIVSAGTLTGHNATTLDTLLNNLDSDGDGTPLLPNYPPTPMRQASRSETILSDFEGSHGWAAHAGTIADSSDVVLFGSKALKLYGTSTSIAKKTFSPALDLSGKELVLWIRVTDVTALVDNDGAGAEITGTIRVSASSDAYSSAYYTWDYTNSSFVPFKNGVWSCLTYNFSSAAVTGTPDRAAINQMRVTIAGDTVNAFEVYIDGLSTISEPQNGVVTLTFDDGYDDHYTEARKKMSEYHFPGTAYIIPSTVGSDGFLTLAQMSEMQDKHGWDISGHHITDLTTLDSGELKKEIWSVKKFLVENGFSKGANEFCYPGGQFNEGVISVVKQYFRSGRTIAQSNMTKESIPPKEYYKLKIYNVLNTTTPATVATLVDQARTGKQWLILVFHQIKETASISTEYSIANFGAIIDDIADDGVRVMTVSEVLNTGV